MGRWQTIKKETVYDTPWIRVYHHNVTTPTGNTSTYGSVHFKVFAIGILVLDEDRNTWIVRQHRYPIDEFVWELPEGGGSRDVSPLESAKRELREETGIVADKWTPLMEMQMSNAATDEYAYLFVAQDLRFEVAQPDADEDLEVKKLPFQELFDRVMSGEIKDSFTVAAVLKTKLLLDRGELD